MRPEPLDSLLRDVEVVQIYYAPETRIILGGSLNQENIKEKSDVYFECLVNSNPTATNIAWLCNVGTLGQDKSSGIII